MADSDQKIGKVVALSDGELRVLLLHALSPHSLNSGSLGGGLASIGLAGDYYAHNRAADSLKSKHLLDDHGLATSEGWSVVASLRDPITTKRIIENSERELQQVTERLASCEDKWRPLLAYVPAFSVELQPSWFNFVGPPTVFQFVDTHLRMARLCGLVSAWAGAIQYCALAVEHTLAEILTANGKLNTREEIPPLGDLLARFGQTFPEASQGTKRLVAAIADYRNTAVHPREPHLRPGEYQARNVYDLTVKFLGSVRREWFNPSQPSP